MSPALEESAGDLKVVPIRHPGRIVAGVALLIVAAMMVHTFFSKVPSGSTTVKGPVWRFSWNVVFQYFTSSLILHGLLVTIELTVIAMLIGITLGLIVAVMRLSPSRLLSTPAWLYTWFFRGTPVLVQILFWYNLALLYPRITLGIPFFHWSAFGFDPKILTAFEAATIALGLNEGAYMSEIARAGLISVDEGQIEAATSIGMTRGQTLRFVIIPQAMRVIIPPTGNEVISMLKTTSIASVISLLEMTGVAEDIYNQNLEVMPLLITISMWYLIVTTGLSIGQFYLERHFSKGATRHLPPTPLQRLRKDLRSVGVIVSRSPSGWSR